MELYSDVLQELSRLLAMQKDGDQIDFRNICRLVPVPPPPLNDLRHKIRSAEANILRLFRKQEYYRRAYNETLQRMDYLVSELPEYARDLVGDLTHPSEELHKTEEVNNNELNLEPGLMEFMLKTLDHQNKQLHKKLNVRGHTPTSRPPPLKPKNSSALSPVTFKIDSLQTYLLHYYEYSSPCRDSPFWPVIPLKNS